MGHEQRPIARPRDFLDDDQERTLRVLVLDGCESGAGANRAPADTSSSSNPVVCVAAGSR
jgi:hypothetical protein